MKKKILLWVIGVYLVFAVIAIVFGSPPESKELIKENEPLQQEETPQINDEVKTIDLPEKDVVLTNDEIIANSVKETLGDKFYKGHYVLDGSLYIESYMTSSNSYQRDIEDHYDYSLRAIEYLYDHLPLDSYISIFISYYADLIEPDGKETEVSLISIEYISDRISKLNFRQENYKTVPNIAEYIYIHPIFKN